MKQHLFSIAALALLVGCARSDASYRRNSGFVFGTTYNLTYRSHQDYNAEVLRRLSVYDASMSVYNDTSLISRLNAGDSVVADAAMLEVFSEARRFYELTNGAFDISVAPLSRLWRFTRSLTNDTIPVELFDGICAKVDSVKSFVGFDKISVEGNVVRKSDRRVAINANALAEGYGIDLAARVLEENGVTDYMVEIGGEIRCRGLNPRGTHWTVGVDRPVEGSPLQRTGHQCVISVTDCSVSTSGNYRQCYHVADGRIVQHTIDPRTGMPVMHGMQSVTVVGPTTLATDALCTSLMVMGPDTAISFIDNILGAEAYIVFLDEQGRQKVEMTEGFRKLIVR